MTGPESDSHNCCLSWQNGPVGTEITCVHGWTAQFPQCAGSWFCLSVQTSGKGAETEGPQFETEKGGREEPMRSQEYFIYASDQQRFALQGLSRSLFFFKKQPVLRYNLYTVKYVPSKCQFDEFGTKIPAYVTTAAVKSGTCLIQRLRHTLWCAGSSNPRASDFGYCSYVTCSQTPSP